MGIYALAAKKLTAAVNGRLKAKPRNGAQRRTTSQRHTTAPLCRCAPLRGFLLGVTSRQTKPIMVHFRQHLTSVSQNFNDFPEIQRIGTERPMASFPVQTIAIKDNLWTYTNYRKKINCCAKSPFKTTQRRQLIQGVY